MKKFLIASLVAISASVACAQSPVPTGTPAPLLPLSAADNQAQYVYQTKQAVNQGFSFSLSLYNRLTSLASSPSFSSLDAATQTQVASLIAALKVELNTVKPGTIQ